jgi:methylmalonyl-CoA mutase
VDSTGTPSDRITGGLMWTPSDLVFDHQESFGLALENLRELVEMTEPYPNFKAFSLNTARYTDSGANPLDALVFGLGELIEVIDKSGLDSGLIFRKMLVDVSVGEAHFGEIARLKSFRILISELATLYEIQLSAEDLILLCQTSCWSKSILDPNTNLIRQTYEAMAAVIGGGNLLWVKSLEEESADERERRIARNVSSILKEEAYLDKVQDPAAGSFFLGNLIGSITEHTKSKLEKLESDGGWLHAFNTGKIHSQVRRYREKIQTDLLEAKLSKIGVNKYPPSGKPASSPEFDLFEEKSFELNPTRASYLCEFDTFQEL